MKLLARSGHLDQLKRLLREHPVVAVLGARQVGKTTLAHQLATRIKGEVSRFDLEDPRDLAQLQEPTLTLEPLRGLVVIDEIQERPDLFSVLRVLADRRPTRARFLVLGSAAPELLRQGSQTLAGRIAFHELGGFDFGEVGITNLERLWFRGGFPRAYLARSHRQAGEWQREFIRTFLQRDVPRFGIGLPPASMERFWTMLAHYHGQVWNASEFSRSFGVSHTTVRKYVDVLTDAFVIEQLRPWAANVGKRVVKSPKVYLRDSGILHALLALPTPKDVMRHPKLGASWEGFILQQIVRALGARSDQCYFWATHAGAELDLLVVDGNRRLGFEIKRTDAPKVTASMNSALDTLKLQRLALVHAGKATFRLTSKINAVAAADIESAIRPLAR